jgi:hypothetical protein
VPALEARGALVVYVDLWADRSKSPATLVLDAVRATLQQMQTCLPAAALQGAELWGLGLTWARSNTWARPAVPRWRRHSLNWWPKPGWMWC